MPEEFANPAEVSRLKTHHIFSVHAMPEEFANPAEFSTGTRCTKSIGSLELCHKEHNNDPYSLHNNTIYFTQ